MEILEEEEREKGTEDIFEVIMAEKVSKLMTDTKPQMQRSSENTKENKYPKNLYQTTESQRQREKKFLRKK